MHSSAELSNMMIGTLDYLINMQDVIIKRIGKFLRINKCAGCNKAMQVGVIQKLINLQDVIRPCRLENLEKLIRTCCTFIR